VFHHAEAYIRRNFTAFAWDGNDLMTKHWDIDFISWDDPSFVWDGRPLVWDDGIHVWDAAPMHGVFGAPQLLRDCCGIESDTLTLTIIKTDIQEIPILGIGPFQPLIVSQGYGVSP